MLAVSEASTPESVRAKQRLGESPWCTPMADSATVKASSSPHMAVSARQLCSPSDTSTNRTNATPKRAS